MGGGGGMEQSVLESGERIDRADRHKVTGVSRIFAKFDL